MSVGQIDFQENGEEKKKTKGDFRTTCHSAPINYAFGGSLTTVGGLWHVDCAGSLSIRLVNQCNDDLTQ